MLIRGPGVAANTTLPHLINNVDLGPTILDLAGLPPMPDSDGRSYAKVLLRRPVAWRNATLIEWTPDHSDLAHWEKTGAAMIDVANNTYRSLRILDPELGSMVYSEFTDFRLNWRWQHPPQEYELYNLEDDPFQLHNIYNTSSPALRARLHAQLDALWHCRHASCN